MLIIVVTEDDKRRLAHTQDFCVMNDPDTVLKYILVDDLAIFETR